MSCTNCGGTLHGDGYTSIQVCENVTDEQREAWSIDYLAPDEGIFYCTVEFD